ncbi:MAG TPA: 1,3-beta-galactosyl-N-acetylhexosamine phosphorylase [Candidatus Borkfalkia avicola]|uniref:1,3-beta-galactosyl-N-acetylhexosamine phosphorylase n=1 Tax=Candidatus Borkfalkia avicola TaxID=2838503 RepID=A0A9D2D6E0_9FIRM|nr:1,3-beta-galactosyl-N-acetylhexosamine phosphorylase [Candidatus Borkfalkia avicola]
MKKGRVTIPTDESFVEGTKKIAALWGADAVRDCDGTKLPENARELADKVYETYFVTRGDVAWAKANPDELQHFFLMSERKIATGATLKIFPAEGYFAQQVKPDFSADALRYWQVVDRTEGKVHTRWKADEREGSVLVEDAEPYHEYTLSFLARNVWDSTQMYNYITNGWDTDRHSPYDPRYPKTAEHIKAALINWLETHPQINVVRFTTFLYHFFLVFNEEGKEKIVDWFGYNASVSPRALDAFEKEYGYALTAEDFVDGGCYNSPHRVPKKSFLDYMDFTMRYVAQTVKELVGIVHARGREAMMFLGDSWIGTEPYGRYFADIGLDAVVGSVGGGVTVRMLSDMPGLKYVEGRMLPYFFPDTFFEGNEQNAVAELNKNWMTARRAMMRAPLDRIGFGGYLSLAAKFPSFVRRSGEICEEFRGIYGSVKGKKPFNVLRVAVLNCWGKLRSWQCFMTAHELWYQQAYSYQGILEALSGLPVEVSFIDFDDVKAGALDAADAVINAGDAYTAWSGGEMWQDARVQEKVRAFVARGGGFVGVGEPTACAADGRFFRLADVLGVDEERGLTLNTDKYNIRAEEGHFIFEDTPAPDYGEGKKNIFALPSAKVLDIVFSDRFTRSVNVGEVRAAANVYGKGRSFYITGLPYSFENARLLYRALLWVTRKEEYVHRIFSTNVKTDCHFYAESGEYALVNNTFEEQKTTFFDKAGKARSLTLAPMEIRRL